MSEPATIQVHCNCGANLRLPAEASGRKARCPKCNSVFIVRQTADSPPAPNSAAKSSPDRVHVRCDCGARLGLPASAAGRKARCPKCHAVVSVPAPEAPALDDFDELLGGLSDGEATQIERTPQPAEPPKRTSDLYGLAPAEEPPAVPKVVDTGPPRECPACKAKYASDAKVCTACGIYLATGRPVLMQDDSHLDNVYMKTESALWLLSFLAPFGFIPIASEAFGVRKPYVIRGIALITLLASVWYFFVFMYASEQEPSHELLMLWSGAVQLSDLEIEVGDVSSEDRVAFEALMSELADHLPRFHAYQLITHMFLHADVFHLAGNLVFLFVFGSRVNALIGNVLTAILYPLLGICAAGAHLLSMQNLPAQPSLGASGVIMGLAGMYFVLMPTPKVHTIAWLRSTIFRVHMKTFAPSGYWVLLFYIAWDVLYTAFGMESDVAHWAHLGGFIAGMAIAFLLLFTRLVNARGGDILTAALGKRAWPLIGPPNRPAITLW